MTAGQRRDFFVLVRNLYLILTVAVTPLFIGLWFYDIHVLSPTARTNPIPTWVTALLGFLVINGGVWGAMVEFARKTRVRGNDPYRFSILQKRFCSVPDVEVRFEGIVGALVHLGYQITEKNITQDTVRIVAFRSKIEGQKRLPKGQARPDQRLCVHAHKAGDRWSVEINCSPTGWQVVGDFTLTTFLSISEAIQRVGWSKHLIDSEGNRIDMNWQAQS